jgi:hypothetical protein
MQEGQTYPVIGISVNGNFMFATPLGGADYHGDRFRVLNGGQYAGVEVTLREVTNKAPSTGKKTRWDIAVNIQRMRQIGRAI